MDMFLRLLRTLTNWPYFAFCTVVLFSLFGRWSWSGCRLVRVRLGDRNQLRIRLQIRLQTRTLNPAKVPSVFKQKVIHLGDIENLPSWQTTARKGWSAAPTLTADMERLKNLNVMNWLIRSGQPGQTLAVNVADTDPDPVRSASFCRIRIRVTQGLQIRIQTKS
jgi:hypothetical protein